MIQEQNYPQSVSGQKLGKLNTVLKCKNLTMGREKTAKASGSGHSKYSAVWPVRLMKISTARSNQQMGKTTWDTRTKQRAAYLARTGTQASLTIPHSENILTTASAGIQKRTQNPKYGATVLILVLDMSSAKYHFALSPLNKNRKGPICL